MLSQEQPILNSIKTYIQPLMKHVLEAEKLGTSYGSIVLDSIESSCGIGMKADRFKLSIPYAGCNLVWNVLFDSQCPEMGPDFLFNDDAFLMDLDHDTLSTAVPSLTKWNVNKEDALLNVLMELLACYKKHQVELLETYQDLLFHYTTLIQSPEVDETDVEIILLPIGCKPKEARFKINFEVDVDLPFFIPFKNKTVKLQVTFYNGPVWNYKQPQLCLSKELENILCGPYAISIPSQFMLENLCLAQFFAILKTEINEKIKLFSKCLEQKSKFISVMISTERNNLVEYDAAKFNYIVLLTQLHYSLFLHFQLPPGFPQNKPTIKYQLEDEILDLKDFPYSPTWKPFMMIKKILTFIRKNFV